MSYSNVEIKPATLLKKLAKIYFRIWGFNFKYSFRIHSGEICNYSKIYSLKICRAYMDQTITDINLE